MQRRTRTDRITSCLRPLGTDCYPIRRGVRGSLSPRSVEVEASAIRRTTQRGCSEWWAGAGSSRRPSAFQADALPTELPAPAPFATKAQRPRIAGRATHAEPEHPYYAKRRKAAIPFRLVISDYPEMVRSSD